MNSEFLKLYNDELNELRKQGKAFSDAYPKIAGRLKLGQGEVEDPLVGRLIESFSFLTARVRYQMQTEMQQVDQNLIQLLYPHYFLPIPSCSTIELQASDRLDTAYNIPEKTKIVSELANGDNCYFTTCYPVTVKPINLSNIRYQREGNIASKQYSAKELKSCLSLQIKTNNPESNLSDFSIDSLRIFINANGIHSNMLYELLMARNKEIILSYGESYKTLNIPLKSIKPVGFSAEQSLLPYPDNSASGYRLLTEYFAYPEKFFYFDIEGLNRFITEDMSDSIEIHFYFNQYYHELEKTVNDDILKLNCTPIVNIFEQSAEPITFNHRQRDYHIIADAQYKQQNIEIYSVQSVSISSSSYADSLDCAPYFARKFSQNKNRYIYWHAMKKSCAMLGQPLMQGNETFLNISDFNLDDINEKLILTPKLLCTNRDAPSHLPFGGGKPKWQFNDEAHELIENIQCVKSITTAKYRQDEESYQKHLSKHVYLNQIGLADKVDTLDSFQSILDIYRFAQEHNDKFLQDGFVDASAKSIIIRHPEKLRQGFCQGMEYTLTIDETYFSEHEHYLIVRMLHEFLSKLCSVNSFVSLVLISKQRGELFRCKPKLGIKPVL